MTIDTNKAIVMVRVPTAAEAEETARKMRDPLFNEAYHKMGMADETFQTDAFKKMTEKLLSPSWRFFIFVHDYLYWPLVAVMVCLSIFLIVMTVAWVLKVCGVGQTRTDKAPLFKHEEAINVDVEPVVMHV